MFPAYAYRGDHLSDQPERPQTVLYLKYWHIVLMLVVQLVALGIAYGRITQQMDDLARRVSAIEDSKFVSRDEFDDFRTDLRTRLDRIESEILEIKQ